MPISTIHRHCHRPHFSGWRCPPKHHCEYPRDHADPAPGHCGNGAEPARQRGNYFSQQSRQATRFAWIENWTPRAHYFAGDHILQLGSVLSYSEDEGQLHGRPVQIQDATGVPCGASILPADNLSPSPISARSVCARPLDIEYPLRSSIWECASKEQTITLTSRTAPRGGFVWTPSEDKKTIFRGGAACFMIPCPLEFMLSTAFPSRLLLGSTLPRYRRGSVHYINITQEAADPAFH